MIDPTTRALIERMAYELDHYRQFLMDDRREVHTLATEARAYLAAEPQGEAAAIPCNCWLDDVPPYRSPCVFDDPRVEVNNCRYATMIQSANKKKTDCKHYHAALAQLEPEGPTDEELIQLAIDTRLFRFQATAGDPFQYEMTEQQVHAFARAVLDRWGRPTPQPPSGEVAELVVRLRDYLSVPLLQERARIADLLERLSPPQPIPVSERLPGPGDCDAEGRCWWFCFECPGENSYWILAKEVYCNPTFWRPFSALPLPPTTTETTDD